MTSAPTFRSRVHAPKQRGQALPLAAIGLFVMALAVIATMNLGQAVHEKIRLQNAADAAAYSLAAMEARAFNFIALTNRVQIVHYNAAMAFQSYATYVGYCIGLFGTLRDLVSDVMSSLRTGCMIPPPVGTPYCTALSALSWLPPVLRIVMRAFSMAYKVIHWSADQLTEAMTLFNRYQVWQMQLLRALQINTHIITGMNDFVKENDPAMTYTAKNNWFNMILNQVLNSLEFQAAFDRGAGLNPFWLDALMRGWQKDLPAWDKKSKPPETEKAYRIMTEIANASRSNADIYDRSNNHVIASNFIAHIVGKKLGATKLVEKGTPDPAVDEIRDRNNSNYLLGKRVASDDFLKFGLGGAVAPPAVVALFPNGVKQIGDGIVTDEKSGKHYHYNFPSGLAAPAGMSGLLALPPMQGVARRSFDKNGDSGKTHKWKGLAPYFKFKPLSKQNSDFNQPSTWMFLNKHHSGFQTGSNKKPWHYTFDWNQSNGSNTGVNQWGERIGGAEVTGTVSLDTTIGGERNSYLFEGLNVISRGLVYYHRPGVWSEHPNMFNPFWRARLAPVGAKLINVFDRFVTQKIRTNSDKVVAQAVVNFVRNFVSDFFLRAVTAVMTH